MILEVFAELWTTSYVGERVPKNNDSTFILCYAIMQLNTDQHNPQVVNRMTLKQFLHNTRGMNDGESFPPEFLEMVYVEIRDKEIVLPAERKGALKEEYDWKMKLLHLKEDYFLAILIGGKMKKEI